MTNIELTLDDKNIRVLLNALSKGCEDTSGVMKNIAEEMSKSVDENFEVGGRYSSPDSMNESGKSLSAIAEQDLAICEIALNPEPNSAYVTREEIENSLDLDQIKFERL